MLKVAYPNGRDMRLTYNGRAVVLRADKDLDPADFVLLRAMTEPVLLQTLVRKAMQADRFAPFEPYALLEWKESEGVSEEHIYQTMNLYKKLKELLSEDFVHEGTALA